MNIQEIRAQIVQQLIQHGQCHDAQHIVSEAEKLVKYIEHGPESATKDVLAKTGELVKAWDKRIDTGVKAVPNQYPHPWTVPYTWPGACMYKLAAANDLIQN